MRFEVTFDGVLVAPGDPSFEGAGVEAFVDAFVAELEILGAMDVDVSTNLATLRISVAIMAEANDMPTAQIEGGGTIRTAFHAVGAGTVGWSIDWTEAKVLPENTDVVDHDEMACN